MMKRYIVESIEFNWRDGDFDCPMSLRPGIVDATLSTVWFGESEDDVINQIRQSAAFDVNFVDLTYLPYKAI